METITTVEAARARRHEQRQRNTTVALVPTMGYLHEGHLSLVRRARELADLVWVSIFVNPTQFGPGEDLASYPRDLERDQAMLRAEGVEVVLAPSAEEMYPQAPVVQISFSGLDEVLCGEHRPGHFAGVGLVVSKLFNIIQPDVAVFGQKDAQQALLIRRLAHDLSFPVAIDVAPTVREADGLAMSSRNAYLTPEERAAAPVLYRALCRARDVILAGGRDREAVEQVMRSTVSEEPVVRVEYAECVSSDGLERAERITSPALLLIAAKVGRSRLIDNIQVEPL
jgi:pantoate--beta-alanine ligase